MRSVLKYGLKEIAAAVVLSSFIAGGVGAMTGPGVSTDARAVTNSVNRSHKGDRLPLAPIAQRPQQSSPATAAPAVAKRAPLGCDPAFSPVADPTRGHIFKRCMA